MATFTTSFLGCKVSFADAQAIRERLLADGHWESGPGADVAVVNTCCVTHEAVSKSRQAVSRLARSSRRVYATGCARSEEHTSELQSHSDLVCRLLLEKKKKTRSTDEIEGREG